MLKLKVLKGPTPGQVITLKAGENTVGRASTCDVVFAVSGISKQHAKIVVQGEQAILTDLGSSNGTFVNGTKVSHRILRRGDRIGFSNVIVELTAQEKVELQNHQTAMVPRGNTSSYQRQNTAHQPNFVPQAQSQPGFQPMAQVQTPELLAKRDLKIASQEYIENVIMPGVYKVARTYPFRQVQAGFVILFIFLVTALATIPMVQLTSESVQKESERRVMSLARQLAVTSERALQSGAVEAALRTDAVESEAGVSIAMIVTPEGRIIAPVGRGETYATSEFSVRARKANKDYLGQFGSHVIGASVPIKSFNAELGQQATVAFAQVLYDTGEVGIDTGRAAGLFARILVIALIVGGALYFLLYKLTVHPLQMVSKQLDLALRGEKQVIENPFNFEELDGLVNNVNAALGRMSAGGAPGINDIKVDRSGEAIQLATMLVDAAFALDSQKRFTHVNPRFEELTNVKLESVQLQMTEVLPDMSLNLSIQDLLARCDVNPGVTQSNYLDIRGSQHVIEIISSPSLQGGAEWYLGVIKPGGGSS